ncbi:MAG: hypothetical protein KIG14_00930 [Candidatus Sacchiramonaceae bacterium]|nr:hypothetical protein [Candidatus Saccharimonadaceae bacterium]
MSRLMDAAQRYLANNPRVNNFPAVSFYGAGERGIINSYIIAVGDEFKDPDGSEYHVDWGTIGNIPTERKDASGRSVIYRFTSAKCDGENTIESPGNKKFAISIVLEGGGVYCLNN